MKGKFIVFEGIDGCGKSTQVRRATEYLTERGIACVSNCEPTQSHFGKLLRSCLVGEIDADERAIASLFATDRLDHIFNVENGIKATLERGVSVLCDRYYFSSLAYNGGFVPFEWVVSLNEIAMREMKPDLTVYIDLPPDVAEARLKKRGKMERYESPERQREIYARYEEVLARFGKENNVVRIASEQNKEDTQAHIRAVLDKLFDL